MDLRDMGGDSGILHDLELQVDENMRAKRNHRRVMVVMKVILRPGNSSDLAKYKWQGVTGDISDGGCRTMFPLPARVGDIYRLEFEHEGMDATMVFARCMRCQLIREDGYEVGFKFFSPLDLSGLQAATDTAKTEDSTFV